MSVTKGDTAEVTLLPGDGIGPEITEAVVLVMEALGSPLVWDRQQAGAAAAEALGDPLPEGTIASIRRTGLALKGPFSTPLAGGYRSATVRLREEFDLFANVRPARTIVAGRYDNIDLILLRENLEGLYIGHEHYLKIGDDPKAVGVALGMNSRAGARRFLRFAFEHAVRLGRKKITAVHKANVLKVLTGIFLEVARETAGEYSGRIAFDERIVDACAMQLVLDPGQFDVIVTTNLFGDILSDEIAGLIGGLGVAPGANIGPDTALFEPIHGSAPDIAGRGTANPVAMLLAAGLLLDHIGRTDLATALRAAIERTIGGASGMRTRDLGGSAATMEVARAIAANLA